MRQIYGLSRNGDLRAAAAKVKRPEAVVYISSEDNFDRHTAEIAALYPDVPSLGGIGQSYAGTETSENGCTVIGLYDVAAEAGVLEEISSRPLLYTGRLTETIRHTGASAGNAACFDFTTGYDGRIVTTLNMILQKAKIPLIGGTVNGTKVAVNGKVYQDACAFMIFRNRTGRIRAYKENIYQPTGRRFLATSTNPEKFELLSIDGHPAARYYQEICGIPSSAVATQTFKNPLGKIYGDETYLISIKEIHGDALVCYKQVNNMDILTLMELMDYKKVVNGTLDQMQRDLGRVNGILSVNCLFRYLLFQQDHYLDQYFKTMNRFGSHAGLVGVGEHYCRQHINQTMTAIAFN